jgi:L-alanine-DL-glutamate epimerase-like enolase superfamily enzyme
MGAPVKIRELSLHPIATERTTGTLHRHVLVSITDQEGRVGWGEMSDLSHLPLYSFDVHELELNLRDILLEKNASNLNGLEASLVGFFPDEGHMYSKAGSIRQGVMTALYDLVARARDLSVAQLLGGAVRESVEVCYPIFRMTHESQVQDAIRCLEAASQLGFGLIRFYAGESVAADQMFLDEFVRNYSDRMRVKSFDLSNRLGWRQALAITHNLGELVEPLLVESPAPRGDLDGLRMFTSHSSFPVSEHAHSVKHAWQLVTQAGVDILNVSPYVLGGFSPSLRVIALAEASGRGVLLGTTQELSVGTAAIAHLGAVAGVLNYPSDAIGPVLYKQDVVADRAGVRDGHLVIPSGPGLGVQVEPELVRELSIGWRDAFRGDVDTLINRRKTAAAT